MTTAVARSRHYLEALTVAHHRGPTDTWTAARDRAAKAAGIERTYAARIWNRWQDMKDVSGEAFMRLSAAYEALCERSLPRRKGSPLRLLSWLRGACTAIKNSFARRQLAKAKRQSRKRDLYPHTDYTEDEA